MTTHDAAAATKLRRCAIYTRKSTEHGLDQVFTSLDAQRDACEAYVRSRSHEGWEALSERYEDGGYTGKDTDRPAFQRMMTDIDAGRIDVIVVYKLDRLTRSVLDFARLMERLDKASAAFVSITESFSTTDAIGRLILHVLMSFAEFEREQIAQRTRDKVRASRRRGLWTGGSSPYGYRLENRRLVIESDTAPVARDVFARYLACESAVQVAQDLTAAGHRREVRRRGELVMTRAWTKNDVLRVIENPLYAGYVPCGPELHEGVHEALIDRATWERVQSVLARNRGANLRRARDPSYLLRGVLRCARCDAAMSPAPTVREARTYRYYRCGTRDKGGKSACGAPQLAADTIERAVAERLRQLALDRTLQDEILAASARRLADRRAVLSASERTMPRQIGALDGDVKRLAGRLTGLDGAAAIAVEEQLRTLGADKGRLEARLVDLRTELLRLDEKERELGWARELVGRLDRVWDLLAPENRARFVSLIVDRVVVDGETGAVEIHLADLAGVTDPMRAATDDAN